MQGIAQPLAGPLLGVGMKNPFLLRLTLLGLPRPHRVRRTPDRPCPNGAHRFICLSTDLRLFLPLSALTRKHTHTPTRSRARFSLCIEVDSSLALRWLHHTHTHQTQAMHRLLWTLPSQRSCGRDSRGSCRATRSSQHSSINTHTRTHADTHIHTHTHTHIHTYTHTHPPTRTRAHAHGPHPTQAMDRLRWTLPSRRSCGRDSRGSCRGMRSSHGAHREAARVHGGTPSGVCVCVCACVVF